MRSACVVYLSSRFYRRAAIGCISSHHSRTWMGCELPIHPSKLRCCKPRQDCGKTDRDPAQGKFATDSPLEEAGVATSVQRDPTQFLMPPHVTLCLVPRTRKSPARTRTDATGMPGASRGTD